MCRSSLASQQKKRWNVFSLIFGCRPCGWLGPRPFTNPSRSAFGGLGQSGVGRRRLPGDKPLRSHSAEHCRAMYGKRLLCGCAVGACHCAFAVSLPQRFPSSSAASPGASIGAGACAFEAVVSATNTHPSMKACDHSRTRLLDKTIGVRVIGEGDTDVDPAAASSTERGE